MVPTFTCGFVRSNFCLAIASLLPTPGRGHRGPDAHLSLPAKLRLLRKVVFCVVAALYFRTGGPQPYSPCARAMISLEIDSGTWLYEWNCIVYVARPWVRERRSVE